MSVPRVVLLGASNLTMRVPAVVAMTLGRLGTPANLFFAMGHGRSFGTRSRVLGRGLPGILESGVFDALDAAPPGPTYAILTDVGNDIAYGVSADTIVRWVTDCLDRLAAHDTRVAMTLLPMDNLRRLSPTHFRIARTLFFPTRRPIGRDAALDAAQQITDRMRDLGRERGLGVLEPVAGWYGLDPLHPRGRHAMAPFTRLIGLWGDGVSALPPAPAPASVARWWRLRTATPRRWWLLGKELGRSQPASTLPDGSVLHVY